MRIILLLLPVLGLGLLAKPEQISKAEQVNFASVGSAKIIFGEIQGKEEVVQIAGNRKIAGIYPHLTTYSQSRKDGRFFKDGHEECGIGGIIPWGQ